MRPILSAHLPDPTQLPQLTIEQPAHDEAEAARLQQLTRLIDATNALPDLRDLTPAVRELFPPPAYQVGCGGAHIWLHRTDESQRLAFIC